MLDINVNIELSGPSGSLGSGVPCILISKSTRDVAYKEYSEAKELVSAGFETNSDAYKLYQIMKMQKDTPALIAVMETTEKAVDVIPKLQGKVR